MALILVFLSVVTGMAVGLWFVDSIPPVMYTYLTVIFLVVLDGLLFSYHRLESGGRIWSRLAQRMALQLAYGAFIIFFGAKAGRDLLLLAVIPLGFNVFANFVQFIPREAGEVYWVPQDMTPTGDETYEEEPRRRRKPAVEARPAAALPEAEITISHAPSMTVEMPVLEGESASSSTSQPFQVPNPAGSITTITVATVAAPTVVVSEEPAVEVPSNGVAKV